MRHGRGFVKQRALMHEAPAELKYDRYFVQIGQKLDIELRDMMDKLEEILLKCNKTAGMGLGLPSTLRRIYLRYLIRC